MKDDTRAAPARAVAGPGSALRLLQKSTLRLGPQTAAEVGHYEGQLGTAPKPSSIAYRISARPGLASAGPAPRFGQETSFDGGPQTPTHSPCPPKSAPLEAWSPRVDLEASSMARRGSAPGFTPRSGSAPGLESLADAATFRLSEAEAAAAASDFQSQFGPWTSQVPLSSAPRSPPACGSSCQWSASTREPWEAIPSVHAVRRKTRSSGGSWRSTARAGRPSRRSSAARATRRSVTMSAVYGASALSIVLSQLHLSIIAAEQC